MDAKEQVQLISWTGEAFVLLVSLAIAIFVWRLSRRKAAQRRQGSESGGRRS